MPEVIKQWVPTLVGNDKVAEILKRFNKMPEPGFMDLYARPPTTGNKSDPDEPRHISFVPTFMRGATPEKDRLRMLMVDNNAGVPEFIYGFVMTREQWFSLPDTLVRGQPFLKQSAVKNIIERLDTAKKQPLLAMECVAMLRALVPEEADMDLSDRNIRFVTHFQHWQRLLWCFVIETDGPEKLVAGFEIKEDQWLEMRGLGNLFFETRCEFGLKKPFIKRMYEKAKAFVIEELPRIMRRLKLHS